MPLNLTPKKQGLFGIALGIFCIAITIYGLRSQGAIYLFPCILGPAILPLCAAQSVFPVEKLLRRNVADRLRGRNYLGS